MSVAGIRKIVVLQLILLFCMNCDQKHSIIEGKSMEIRNDLKILATKRIFFGHQSVGQNIVEALKDIAQQNSEADFHIVTPMDDEKLPAHFFAEGKIGRNQQPELKCKDFQEENHLRPSLFLIWQLSNPPSRMDAAKSMMLTAKNISA
ncbi:MAG: hypothetical protein P8184_15225 [Calditrichia bacterium]